MKLFGVIAIVLTLFTTFLYQRSTFFDNKLHVVFCNVGQGDAIFIKSPTGFTMLVDAGPDDAVIACLSRHMPFWERTINLVLLTHPHADHFIGFLDLFRRYRVTAFATEKLTNKAVSFARMLDEISLQKIPVQYLFAGDTFKTKDSVTIRILGPTADFLAKTSPNALIGESSEFGSLLTLIRFGTFSLLLTGDSQAAEIKEGMGLFVDKAAIDVFQEPHHGSKTGIDEELLSLVDPKLVVISVGKKNRYGHPSSQVLQLLQEHALRVFRTDNNGDIEIITDGKTVMTKTDHE